MNFKLRTLFLFFTMTIIVLSMVYCGSNNKTENSVNTNPYPYLNHNDTAHYVGMSQCKLCHQKIYDSFLQTGMGQSFAHASKQKSAGDFSKHIAIYDKYSDFYYYPYWDNDTMKIMEYRLSGKDTIHKRIENVDYIIGSGQHTNSHIHTTNGYLNQMPMTFYTQKKQWDLPPGFENGVNTRFSRKIGLECMGCHNAFPNFVKGSENKYTEIPEGINCERCHGPGSIHIQQRQLGNKVDTSLYIDYSIVNPGKLPIDLQFDVCQRCHLQGNTVLKDDKSFYDFKPGMKLSDYMTVFLPRYKNAEDEFIMASHADRLKQSKCFIKSFQAETDSKSLRPYKNSLTCVTCHNPHVSVKVTGQEIFNAACNNCHGKSNTLLCSEKPTIRAKQRDNCVSCHMPKSGSIDIPHVTVHDHFIRKPSKILKLKKKKEFMGLFAVNEKNPDAISKAKAYLQQYEKFDGKPELLDSAKQYLNDNTSVDVKQNINQLIQLCFAKQDFQKIIHYVDLVGRDYLLNTLLITPSFDNRHAWTLYRIGETYYNSGNAPEAYLFYQQACTLAPFNLEFKNKLGASLMALNKTKEASNIFSEILNENPKFVMAINNLGYANLISGNTDAAETLYNKALKLDPDYEPLLMNVAGLYIYKKEYTKAKAILKNVITKNPANNQAKQVLNQLQALK